MTTIPYSTTRSDGSATLAHHLTVALHDFQRAFGHEPAQIRVPLFRDREIDQSLLVFRNGRAFFRGIDFRFSVTSNLIELGPA